MYYLEIIGKNGKSLGYQVLRTKAEAWDYFVNVTQAGPQSVRFMCSIPGAELTPADEMDGASHE